jgi:hypothetical protein
MSYEFKRLTRVYKVHSGLLSFFMCFFNFIHKHFVTFFIYFYGIFSVVLKATRVNSDLFSTFVESSFSKRNFIL